MQNKNDIEEPIRHIHALARENVVDMLPYVPGKPIFEVKEEFGLERVVKMASNECPLTLPPGLGEVMVRAAACGNTYPDALCRSLRKKTARHINVSEDNLIFGNGAEECIRLIAQILLNQGDRAIIPTPIFDAYSTATRLMGAEEIRLPLKGLRIDLDTVLEACEHHDRVKLVWLCSPSNPTGDILTRDELDRFLNHLPKDIMVVLDEAYAEFVTDKEAVNTGDYLSKDHRVIGLRTFSKAYGLAGFRVGYIVAHPAVVSLVNNVKLPFNVSTPALAAAEYMLDEQEFARDHVELILNEREFMHKELTQRGFEVPKSQANFLFVKMPEKMNKNGVDMFKQLLPKGFIVRPGTAFGVPEYFRMSLGAREDNINFLKEFDKILITC
ncbi:MAG: histidinol-phosphate transaminase [Desulfobacteraceae bacterium 4572_89]|nr:MAG: histidinol-phosphate transaminase [Desulfobacteraceae bacterium 4572_89]